jgi:hypothetical protein
MGHVAVPAGCANDGRPGGIGVHRGGGRGDRGGRGGPGRWWSSWRWPGAVVVVVAGGGAVVVTAYGTGPRPRRLGRAGRGWRRQGGHGHRGHDHGRCSGGRARRGGRAVRRVRRPGGRPRRAGRPCGRPCPDGGQDDAPGHGPHRGPFGLGRDGLGPGRGRIAGLHGGPGRLHVPAHPGHVVSGRVFSGGRGRAGGGKKDEEKGRDADQAKQAGGHGGRRGDVRVLVKV